MSLNYFFQESERLKYRALTQDDIPVWSAFFENNDRLHFFNLEQDCDGNEIAKIWIERQINRYKDNGFGLLAAIEKSTGSLTGIVGLIPRDFEKGPDLEIGYSFLPEFWGKGYATEGAIHMRKFAEKNNLAPRVVSMINPDNFASIRVAERNNMKPLFELIFEGDLHIVYGTEKFNSQ